MGRSYDGPTGEAEERQEEARSGERDGQAKHDLDQLAEAARGIAEGQRQDQRQGERETDRITARVNAVSRDAAGKLVVGLDNGQVWRQLKAETVRIAIDDRVVIERGMLASFFFRVNDSSRKIKFTRVR